MQGFNMGRYMPPATLDNALSSKSEKGFNEDTRKKRGPGGAQTVRFEMPFAIWCTTCQPETIIGQGIRFNAEKKKVGNYFSTPIWAFRMKHGACGGTLEIRTDPEQREYVVTEGARRRETAAASSEGAFGEILTEAERERRRTDAFAQLEGKKQEKQVARTENDRVEELLDYSQANWEDTYTLNQRLRRSFRADRKVREINNKQKESISEKYGLSLELLDNTSDDAIQASLVDFDGGSGSNSSTSHMPLFKSTVDGSSKHALALQHRGRSGAKAEVRSAKLKAGIMSNTRAASDPFLHSGASSPAPALQLKRKRKADGDDDLLSTSSLQRNAGSNVEKADLEASRARPLIDYGSDSE